MDLKFALTPTVDKVVFSPATIVAAIGPAGEGKTWGVIINMAVHAQKFYEHQLNKWAGNIDVVEKMRLVILRDSLENIKRHTVPSIQAALKNSVEFYDDFKRMRGPHMDGTLIGMTDYSALSKIQYGAEFTWGWLEEPAPMVAGMSAGLMEESFDAAIARCARQRFAIPRVNVSMNPPEEDHWTYRVFYENSRNYPLPSEAKDGEVSLDIFHIPYGENPHLAKAAREATKAAFRHNEALYSRFVLGEAAFTSLGQPITPGYDEHIHRTAVGTKIDPIDGIPVFRFWDGWLNPSCVFVQVVDGQWRVLDALRGDNIAVKQLIDNYVKPLMMQRYRKINDWRDVGDPSMATPDQSNVEHSAALTIEKELDTRFEKGAVRVEPRMEAMNKLIFENVSPGKPKLMLSYHEQLLHRALRGGYCYAKDRLGNVRTNKPDKNIHSHIGDAFSYGVEKIFGVTRPSAALMEQIEKTEMELVLSYA